MAKPSKTVVPSQPVARTEVRNSPIPKAAGPAGTFGAATTTRPATAATPSVRPASKQISHELIARRAYEIWKSGQGGTDFENWIRAERELRGV